MKFTICHYKEDRKYKSSAILGQEIVEGNEEELKAALEELTSKGHKVQGWIEDNGLTKEARSQVRPHKTTH